MYPSVLDRYRIIEKLTKQARLSFRGKGIDQEALAKRARVGQGTISNVENLQKSLANPKRRVSREELLKVLVWGLELPQERIDALVWLYDGEPLRPDEIRRFVRIEESNPRESHPAALRSIALNWLRDLVDHAIAGAGPHLAKVSMLSADQRGHLQADRALLDLETTPGLRLFVAPYPAIFTRPPGADPSVRPIGASVFENKGALARHAELYRATLRLYGERGIHSRQVIEAAWHRTSGDTDARERLRRRLRGWIELLQTYDHYEVALAETTPEFFIHIKSTVHVIIGATDMNWGNGIALHWGPRWIEWLDETSVLRFLVDFEAHWDAVPLEHRQKENVIAWIERLLGS